LKKLLLLALLIPACGIKKENNSHQEPNSAPIVSENVLKPIEVKKIDFPIKVLKNKQDGWVEVGMILDKNGYVKQARVIKSSPKGVFDQCIKRSILRWRFELPVQFDETLEYSYLVEINLD